MLKKNKFFTAKYLAVKSLRRLKVVPRRWRSFGSVSLVHVLRLLRVQDDVHGDGRGEAVQHLLDLLLRNAVFVPPLQLVRIELPAGLRFTEVHFVSSVQSHLNIWLHFPGLEVCVVNDDGRAAVVQSVFSSALVPFMCCTEEAGLVVVSIAVCKVVICAQYDSIWTDGQQLSGPCGFPRTW